MRARLSGFARLAAVAAVGLLVVGCEASSYGAVTGGHPHSQVKFIVPLATAIAPPPQVPFGLPNPALDGVAGRIRQATNMAAARGATVSLALLDRSTGQLLSNGRNASMAIASVAKLFIADDLLSSGSLSAVDRANLDTMLQSSDDDAGEVFWNRDGGNAIIRRVTARYGLSATTPGGDDRWWNVISTPADLVRYYDMMLGGAGGLTPAQANTIIDNLARSTPTGIDGYPQRFGIPDGLFAEPVAVKQGWMCCVGDSWMHLSTGVIGADRRYVMAIGSLQPGNDATARATITQVVKTIFPTGRV